MNIFGLLIVAYNRPDYLQQCFQSLYESNLPDNLKILLIDDCSPEVEVWEAMQQFKVIVQYRNPSISCYLHRMPVNSKIRHCLHTGIDILFKEGCDIITNLDGDAIIKPNALQDVFALKEKHPDNIVSGFNNINHGNKIIHQYDDCAIKAYIGGINTCFDKILYDKYIYPQLLKEGNWDYNTSLACREDNKSFYVTSPSVVQHIGMVSSMGHTQGGAKPDEAYDY
jgi:GT2 family glycosyltransferase